MSPFTFGALEIVALLLLLQHGDSTRYHETPQWKWQLHDAGGFPVCDASSKRGKTQIDKMWNCPGSWALLFNLGTEQGGGKRQLIKLKRREEAESSRKARLCFRCSEEVGQMPETDVISLQLRWWALCIRSGNLMFLLCLWVTGSCLSFLSLCPPACLCYRSTCGFHLSFYP